MQPQGTMATPPLRVVQWATGTVGSYALRSLIDRPEFELVGLVVHDPEKIGRDAGELAGREPLGVEAVGSLDRVLDWAPDCVSHMPAPSIFFGDDPDWDRQVLSTLLRAGINVVTTAGFVYPEPATWRELDEAARWGEASVHGTGLNPGFIGDLLPLVASGVMARTDQVFAREASDMTRYPSSAVVCEQMGFGSEPDAYADKVKAFRRFMVATFSESIRMIAAGLGASLDEVRTEDEVAVAPQPLDTAVGRMVAGTVAASRWRFIGVIHGEERVEVEAVYKVCPEVMRDWCSPGLTVEIEGRPQLKMEVGEKWLSNGLLATAARAVNAIPVMCSAAPGVRTCLDLPPITGRGTVR